ncbi:MAG: hypothetical protein ACFFE8_03245 [Candidatus Heimdallarchaeota archaeon]
MIQMFLVFFGRIGTIFPAVKRPSRDLSPIEKVSWTLIVFAAYSLLISIPLIGAHVGEADPFAYLRVIYAPPLGYLGTLGIFPILLAGLIMRFILLRRTINNDFTSVKGKAAYNASLKGMAITFTILGAFLVMLGEYFGVNLTVDRQIIIFGQLVVGGIIAIYLDEIISKGWGYGSGIALFILSTIGLDLFMYLFSVQAVLEGTNDILSNRGLILAFLSWINQENVFAAIVALLFRYDPQNNLVLPAYSLSSFLVTIIFFLLLNYIGAFKFKICIKDQPTERQDCEYQGNILFFLLIPVILTSVMFSSISFLAQVVWNAGASGGQKPPDILVSLLGTFRADHVSGQYVPESGLAYLLTPPQSLIGDSGLISPVDPLSALTRGIMYGLIFVGFSIYFLGQILKPLDPERADILMMLPVIGFFKIDSFSQNNNDILNNQPYQIRSARSWGLRFLVLLMIAQILGLFTTAVGLYVCVAILKRYSEILDDDSRKFGILEFYL